MLMEYRASNCSSDSRSYRPLPSSSTSSTCFGAAAVISPVSERAAKRTNAHVSRQLDLYANTSMPEVSLPFTEVRTSRSILSSY
jgi:hypothetical protein